MANVKVAVRVRPLCKREEDNGAVSVVNIHNKTLLSITNWKLGGADEGDRHRERVKYFSFDYVFNSCDKWDENYASQEKVYLKLGPEIISAACDGYNTCLFAYGQTSSGKTYTMVGDEEGPGLIPRISEGLFNSVSSLKGDVTYKFEISFMEIYNEKVRDLLSPIGTAKFTLRVREHSKDGPYVPDLSKHIVSDYSQMLALLDQGMVNRTTASTHMHEFSSRSHAIFTIHFVQAKMDQHLPSEIVSKINLVDLAGSERANLNYSRDRIQEGANINKSLVMLGNCISALAENALSTVSTDSLPSEDGELVSSLKRKPSIGFVPYRNSVLTWLLKDSLGGNSKTIMIATVSPASIHYNETMSTLRYARRATHIVNQPIINEDPHVRVIRELRSEIQRLKSLLCSASLASSTASLTQQDNPINQMLQDNEVRVDQLTEAWVYKWKDAAEIMRDCNVGIRRESVAVVVESELPHLIGLSDDLSNGIILYHLQDGCTRIGTEDTDTFQDIVLNSSVDVQSEHAIIMNENDVVTLYPMTDAKCVVNGVDVHEPIQLKQGAVIFMGKTNMFRFNHPKQAAQIRQKRAHGSLSYFRTHRLRALAAANLSPSRSTGSISENSWDHEDTESLLEQMSLLLSPRSLDRIYDDEEEIDDDDEGYSNDSCAFESPKGDATSDESECEDLSDQRESIERQREAVSRLKEEHSIRVEEAEDEIKGLRDQLAKDREEGTERLLEEVQLLLDASLDRSVPKFVELKSFQQPNPLDVSQKYLVLKELVMLHSEKKAEANLERKQAAADIQKMASELKIQEEENRLQEMEGSASSSSFNGRMSSACSEDTGSSNSLDGRLGKSASVKPKRSSAKSLSNVKGNAASELRRKHILEKNRGASVPTDRSAVPIPKRTRHKKLKDEKPNASDAGKQLNKRDKAEKPKRKTVFSRLFPQNKPKFDFLRKRDQPEFEEFDVSGDHIMERGQLTRREVSPSKNRTLPASSRHRMDDLSHIKHKVEDRNMPAGSSRKPRDELKHSGMSSTLPRTDCQEGRKSERGASKSRPSRLDHDKLAKHREVGRTNSLPNISAKGVRKSRRSGSNPNIKQKILKKGERKLAVWQNDGGSPLRRKEFLQSGNYPEDCLSPSKFPKKISARRQCSAEIWQSLENFPVHKGSAEAYYMPWHSEKCVSLEDLSRDSPANSESWERSSSMFDLSHPSEEGNEDTDIGHIKYTTTAKAAQPSEQPKQLGYVEVDVGNRELDDMPIGGTDTDDDIVSDIDDDSLEQGVSFLSESEMSDHLEEDPGGTDVGDIHIQPWEIDILPTINESGSSLISISHSLLSPSDLDVTGEDFAKGVDSNGYINSPICGPGHDSEHLPGEQPTETADEKDDSPGTILPDILLFRDLEVEDISGNKLEESRLDHSRMSLSWEEQTLDKGPGIAEVIEKYPISSGGTAMRIDSMLEDVNDALLSPNHPPLTVIPINGEIDTTGEQGDPDPVDDVIPCHGSIDGDNTNNPTHTKQNCRMGNSKNGVLPFDDPQSIVKLQEGTEQNGWDADMLAPISDDEEGNSKPREAEYQPRTAEDYLPQQQDTRDGGDDSLLCESPPQRAVNVTQQDGNMNGILGNTDIIMVEPLLDDGYEGMSSHSCSSLESANDMLLDVGTDEQNIAANSSTSQLCPLATVFIGSKEDWIGDVTKKASIIKPQNGLEEDYDDDETTDKNHDTEEEEYYGILDTVSIPEEGGSGDGSGNPAELQEVEGVGGNEQEKVSDDDGKNQEDILDGGEDDAILHEHPLLDIPSDVSTRYEISVDMDSSAIAELQSVPDTVDEDGPEQDHDDDVQCADGEEEDERGHGNLELHEHCELYFDDTTGDGNGIGSENPAIAKLQMIVPDTAVENGQNSDSADGMSTELEEDDEVWESCQEEDQESDEERQIKDECGILEARPLNATESVKLDIVRENSHNQDGVDELKIQTRKCDEDPCILEPHEHSSSSAHSYGSTDNGVCGFTGNSLLAILLSPTPGTVPTVSENAQENDGIVVNTQDDNLGILELLEHPALCTFPDAHIGDEICGGTEIPAIVNLESPVPDIVEEEGQGMDCYDDEARVQEEGNKDEEDHGFLEMHEPLPLKNILDDLTEDDPLIANIELMEPDTVEEDGLEQDGDAEVKQQEEGNKGNNDLGLHEHLPSRTISDNLTEDDPLIADLDSMVPDAVEEKIHKKDGDDEAREQREGNKDENNHSVPELDEHLPPRTNTDDLTEEDPLIDILDLKNPQEKDGDEEARDQEGGNRNYKDSGIMEVKEHLPPRTISDDLIEEDPLIANLDLMVPHAVEENGQDEDGDDEVRVQEDGKKDDEDHGILGLHQHLPPRTISGYLTEDDSLVANVDSMMPDAVEDNGQEEDSDDEPREQEDKGGEVLEVCEHSSLCTVPRDSKADGEFSGTAGPNMVNLDSVERDTFIKNDGEIVGDHETADGKEEGDGDHGVLELNEYPSRCTVSDGPTANGFCGGTENRLINIKLVAPDTVENNAQEKVEAGEREKYNEDDEDHGINVELHEPPAPTTASNGPIDLVCGSTELPVIGNLELVVSDTTKWDDNDETREDEEGDETHGILRVNMNPSPSTDNGEDENALELDCEAREEVRVTDNHPKMDTTGSSLFGEPPVDNWSDGPADNMPSDEDDLSSSHDSAIDSIPEEAAFELTEEEMDLPSHLDHGPDDHNPHQTDTESGNEAGISRFSINFDGRLDVESIVADVTSEKTAKEDGPLDSQVNEISEQEEDRTTAKLQCEADRIEETVDQSNQMRPYLITGCDGGEQLSMDSGDCLLNEDTVESPGKEAAIGTSWETSSDRCNEKNMSSESPSFDEDMSVGKPESNGAINSVEAYCQTDTCSGNRLMEDVSCSEHARNGSAGADIQLVPKRNHERGSTSEAKTVDAYCQTNPLKNGINTDDIMTGDLHSSDDSTSKDSNSELPEEIPDTLDPNGGDSGCDDPGIHSERPVRTNEETSPKHTVSLLPSPVGTDHDRVFTESSCQTESLRNINVLYNPELGDEEIPEPSSKCSFEEGNKNTILIETGIQTRPQELTRDISAQHGRSLLHSDSTPLSVLYLHDPSVAHNMVSDGDVPKTKLPPCNLVDHFSQTETIDMGDSLETSKRLLLTERMDEVSPDNVENDSESKHFCQQAVLWNHHAQTELSLPCANQLPEVVFLSESATKDDSDCKIYDYSLPNADIVLQMKNADLEFLAEDNCSESSDEASSLSRGTLSENDDPKSTSSGDNLDQRACLPDQMFKDSSSSDILAEGCSNRNNSNSNLSHTHEQSDDWDVSTIIGGNQEDSGMQPGDEPAAHIVVRMSPCRKNVHSTPTCASQQGNLINEKVEMNSSGNDNDGSCEFSNLDGVTEVESMERDDDSFPTNDLSSCVGLPVSTPGHSQTSRVIPHEPLRSGQPAVVDIPTWTSDRAEEEVHLEEPTIEERCSSECLKEELSAEENLEPVTNFAIYLTSFERTDDSDDAHDSDESIVFSDNDSPLSLPDVKLDFDGGNQTQDEFPLHQQQHQCQEEWDKQRDLCGNHDNSGREAERIRNDGGSDPCSMASASVKDGCVDQLVKDGEAVPQRGVSNSNIPCLSNAVYVVTSGSVESTGEVREDEHRQYLPAPMSDSPESLTAPVKPCGLGAPNYEACLYSDCYGDTDECQNGIGDKTDSGSSAKGDCYLHDDQSEHHFSEKKEQESVDLRLSPKRVSFADSSLQENEENSMKETVTAESCTPDEFSNNEDVDEIDVASFRKNVITTGLVFNCDKRYVISCEELFDPYSLSTIQEESPLPELLSSPVSRNHKVPSFSSTVMEGGDLCDVPAESEEFLNIYESDSEEEFHDSDGEVTDSNQQKSDTTVDALWFPPRVEVSLINDIFTAERDLPNDHVRSPVAESSGGPPNNGCEGLDNRFAQPYQTLQDNPNVSEFGGHNIHGSRASVTPTRYSPPEAAVILSPPDSTFRYPPSLITFASPMARFTSASPCSSPDLEVSTSTLEMPMGTTCGDSDLSEGDITPCIRRTFHRIPKDRNLPAEDFHKSDENSLVHYSQHRLSLVRVPEIDQESATQKLLLAGAEMAPASAGEMCSLADTDQSNPTTTWFLIASESNKRSVDATCAENFPGSICHADTNSTSAPCSRTSPQMLSNAFPTCRPTMSTSYTQTSQDPPSWADPSLRKNNCTQTSSCPFPQRDSLQPSSENYVKRQTCRSLSPSEDFQWDLYPLLTNFGPATFQRSVSLPALDNPLLVSPQGQQFEEMSSAGASSTRATCTVTNNNTFHDRTEKRHASDEFGDDRLLRAFPIKVGVNDLQECIEDATFTCHDSLGPPADTDLTSSQLCVRCKSSIECVDGATMNSSRDVGGDAVMAYVVSEQVHREAVMPSCHVDLYQRISNLRYDSPAESQSSRTSSRQTKADGVPSADTPEPLDGVSEGTNSLEDGLVQREVEEFVSQTVNISAFSDISINSEFTDEEESSEYEEIKSYKDLIARQTGSDEITGRRVGRGSHQPAVEADFDSGGVDSDLLVDRMEPELAALMSNSATPVEHLVTSTNSASHPWDVKGSSSMPDRTNMESDGHDKISVDLPIQRAKGHSNDYVLSVNINIPPFSSRVEKCCNSSSYIPNHQPPSAVTASGSQDSEVTRSEELQRSIEGWVSSQSNRTSLVKQEMALNPPRFPSESTESHLTSSSGVFTGSLQTDEVESPPDGFDHQTSPVDSALSEENNTHASSDLKNFYPRNGVKKPVNNCDLEIRGEMCSPDGVGTQVGWSVMGEAWSSPPEVDALRDERDSVRRLSNSWDRSDLAVELMEAQVMHGIGETDAFLQFLDSDLSEEDWLKAQCTLQKPLAKENRGILALGNKNNRTENHPNDPRRSASFSLHGEAVHSRSAPPPSSRRAFKSSPSWSNGPTLSKSVSPHLDAALEREMLPSEHRKYVQNMRRNLLNETSLREETRASEALLRECRDLHMSSESQIAQAQKKLRGAREEGVVHHPGQTEEWRLREPGHQELRRKGRLSGRKNRRTNEDRIDREIQLLQAARVAGGLEHGTKENPSEESSTGAVGQRNRGRPSRTLRNPLPLVKSRSIRSLKERLQEIEKEERQRQRQRDEGVRRGGMSKNLQELSESECSVLIEQTLHSFLRESLVLEGVELLRARRGDECGGWRFLSEITESFNFEKTALCHDTKWYSGVGFIRAPASSVFNILKNPANLPIIFSQFLDGMTTNCQFANSTSIVQLKFNKYCFNHSEMVACAFGAIRMGDTFVVGAASLHSIDELRLSPVIDTNISCFGFCLHPLSTDGMEHCRITIILKVEQLRDCEWDLLPLILRKLPSSLITNIRDMVEIGHL